MHRRRGLSYARTTNGFAVRVVFSAMLITFFVNSSKSGPRRKKCLDSSEKSNLLFARLQSSIYLLVEISLPNN